MRAPATIALVLMGGGALATGVAMSGDSRACRDARARGDSNVEAACRSSHGGSSGVYGGNGYHGRSVSGSMFTGSTSGEAVHAGSSEASHASSGEASASAGRGGFGGAGAHASGGGS